MIPGDGTKATFFLLLPMAVLFAKYLTTDGYPKKQQKQTNKTKAIAIFNTPVIFSMSPGSGPLNVTCVT